MAGLLRWLLGDLVQDIVGIVVGDWVHEMRIRNLLALRSHSIDALRIRKVGSEKRHVDPEFVRPLLKAAANESDDDLLKLWAELLATSLDPSTAALVRRSFVELLQQLDAIDARVLNSISSISHRRDVNARRDHGPSLLGGVSLLEIENDLGIHHFHIRVSLQQLERLQCVRIRGYYSGTNWWELEYVGVELMRALHPVDCERDA